MHLDHINIKGPRPLLERVRDFYCTVIGLREGYRPRFSSSGYWLYAGDQPLVHLSLGSEMHGTKRSGYLDHVAFRADDLQDFLARLDGHKIDYRSSHIPELGLTQLFLSDPAGTGLEINFTTEAKS